MAKDVWFGVHAPPEGHDFNYMRDVCLRAETLGYNLFTMTDHFMNMANPNAHTDHPLECWTTLAGLAASTHMIKLSALVTCYAYRAPTVLAKMATTVDIISGGRLIFGIGAGWHETEFKGFLGRFPTAGERLRGLEETIEICREMFTHERSSFKGKMFQVENVLNSPLPVQRPLPIMVGGGGEKRTLRIAAKYADISHFFARDLETLDVKLKALRTHCRNVFRDYDSVRKGLGFGTILGDEGEVERKLARAAEERSTTVETLRGRIGPLIGTPEKVAEALNTFVDRGVGLITLSFYNLDDMDLFAKEAKPLITGR